MVEKGIRGGICHSIYQYAKANNKYMKYYNNYDVNNSYGWAMSQKFPVNNVEWIKDVSQFNENFIEVYNEEGDDRYYLEVDVRYLERLPERRKIEKFEKPVANLHDKTEYVIHTRNLK